MKKPKITKPKYEVKNSCGTRKGKCYEITLLPEMKIAA